jgi:CBS domain-containing membrane protein
MHLIKQLFKVLVADLPSLGAKEKLKACVGALLGILLTGVLSKYAAQQIVNTSALWLIAPVGASSILLFAMPSSPFSKPWSIVGGNLISSLVGISVAQCLGTDLTAGAIAVFISIYLMFTLRCVHPPSGAVALMCVIGGESITGLGYQFVIFPLLINSLIMVICSLSFHQITQLIEQKVDHKHQHKKAHSLADHHNSHQAKSDLETVLMERDEVFDISLEDLESIFEQTQIKAFNRNYDWLTCAQAMSEEVPHFEFATHLDEAWAIIQVKNMQAIPVLSRAGHLLGVVTRSDFMKSVNSSNYANLADRLKHFLKRNTTSHSDRPEVVGQIMRNDVSSVLENSPLLQAAELMLDQKMRHIPVVNAQGLFLGMINQTDMIQALYKILLNTATPSQATTQGFV